MPKKAKVSNKSTIIFAIILSVAMFIAGFYVRDVYENKQKEQANAVAADFVNAILAGDNETAYDLASSELKEVQSLEEFTEAIGPYADGAKNEAAAAVLEGDGRYLQIQIVDNLAPEEVGTPSAQFYTTLTRDGRDWRVFSLNIN